MGFFLLERAMGWRNVIGLGSMYYEFMHYLNVRFSIHLIDRYILSRFASPFSTMMLHGSIVQVSTVDSHLNAL
jgi:hypothetical protein